MAENIWISTGEAARRLSVSYPKCARWVYERKLDARFVDRRWEINPASVERLRRKRARAALSDGSRGESEPAKGNGPC